MPALRPAVKRRRAWIISIIAAVLLAATLADWNRPPRSQVSVQLYEKVVIRGYRAFARPLVASLVRCRFHPTCSQYSLEVMQRRGFAPGLWLTCRRLLRCNPWASPGTHDPVPAR